MTPRITMAVALRVLTQLRHDPRTIGLLIAVPCVVLTLLRWMYDARQILFNSLGPSLVALIPFIVMFLVTSITTLRERSSGTLERLLAMPAGKLDLLLGYGLAFGLAATVQSIVLVALCMWGLGLTIGGPVWMLVVVAVANAVLGTAFGLFVSAFARTEFQAVQFMPAVVFPQILLCGLFIAREQLPDFLHVASNVLPLSYSVDAMQGVAAGTADGGIPTDVGWDLLVVVAFAVALLGLGAATLRRRTA